MAFGNPISTGTYVPGQTTSGSAGYIVQFDLSDQNPASVDWIQIEDSTANTVFPKVAGATDQASVQALLNSPGTTDLAYYANGNTVGVFFNATTYPLNTSTSLPDSKFGIAFGYSANAARVNSLTDSLDIPDPSWNLFMALAAQDAYQVKGTRVPIDTTNTITDEETALGL